MDSELQETSALVPKMIKPITTVPRNKSKGKTSINSSSKRKKLTKSKRGTTKTTLSMTDLYEKKNPFISTFVEANVGTSEKDPKIIDAEVTVKTTADVASYEVEKGNLDVILKAIVSESNRKLGLEDTNVAIDSPKHMSVDDPKPDNENMEDGFIQRSPEKTDELTNVEPNVETSLS